MLEGPKLGHGRHQTRILTLDPDFVLYTHFVSFEGESLVSFIVRWSSRCAQGMCKPVSDTESRIGWCVDGIRCRCACATLNELESAYMQNQGGLTYGEVEGHVLGQIGLKHLWRRSASRQKQTIEVDASHLFIERILVPWLGYVRPSLQGLIRFLHVVM